MLIYTHYKVVKYWDDFTSGGNGEQVLQETGKGIEQDQTGASEMGAAKSKKDDTAGDNEKVPSEDDDQTGGMEKKEEDTDAGDNEEVPSEDNDQTGETEVKEEDTDAGEEDADAGEEDTDAGAGEEDTDGEETEAPAADDE